MKVIFPTILMLFIAFSSVAQKDSNRNGMILTINYGIGSPINVHNSTNYTNDYNYQLYTYYFYYNTIYGSTALQGTSLSGSVTIPIIHNRWSAIVMGSYYVNPFENVQAMNSSNYMSGFDLMNLQGSEYKEYNLLAGMMKTFTRNRFNVDIWAALGYTKLYAQGITFDEYGSSSSIYYYDIPAANGGGLAIDMGAGIRYRIIKNLFIALHVDWYHAGFTYANNWTVNPPPPTSINGHTGTIVEPPANIAERMNLINISGGLAYQF